MNENNEISKGNKTRLSIAGPGMEKRKAIRKRVIAKEDSHVNLVVDLVQVALKNKLNADRDPLTGLRSRSAFENNKIWDFEILKREGGAFVFVDLNSLKETNDSLGHEKGDILLQNLGALLSSNFPSTDALYRFGGDEAKIYIAGIPEDVIEKRFFQLVKKANKNSQKDPLAPKMSIGVAYMSPSSQISFEALQARADVAMYNAKQKKGDGKSHVVRWTEGMRMPTQAEQNNTLRIKPTLIERARSRARSILTMFAKR